MAKNKTNAQVFRALANVDSVELAVIRAMFTDFIEKNLADKEGIREAHAKGMVHPNLIIQSLETANKILKFD